MNTPHLFIAPPGAGKTTFKNKYPGAFIDPEESIDWNKMHLMHGLYKETARRNDSAQKWESEMDWPTIWVHEIIPRIRTAFLLNKNIIMGLVPPAAAEMVRCFLRPLKENVSIILPEEAKHFEQVWNDAIRGNSWGPEVRGWQNTVWNRLLLRGLAEDLSLPVTDEPQLPERKERNDAGISSREARDEKGKKFIEAFPGRWILLSDNDEIIATYSETRANDTGVFLSCDRTSRICGGGTHDCKNEICLNTEMHGRPLTDWIASDKFQTAKEQNTKNAIIFFAGTFAPFHRGHLAAMDEAKDYLKKQGWNVLGGYVSAFSKIKDDRADTLFDVLGNVRTRSALLDLGTMQSDWIMTDFPVEHVLHVSLLEENKHPLQRIAKRLRENRALSEKTPVTIFWLNGKDAIMKQEFFSRFSEFADSDPLNKLRMIIIDNRESKDNWEEEILSFSTPSLLPYISRCTGKDPNPTSATKVREALSLGDRNALTESIGLPLVESYLMGVMNERETRGTQYLLTPLTTLSTPCPCRISEI